MYKEKSVDFLAQWTKSIERRREKYPEKFDGKQCLRVVHDEGTPLRADLLGEVLQLGWWQDSLDNAPDEYQIQKLLHLTGAKFFGFTFHSRSQIDKKRFHGTIPSDSWTAWENNIQYIFYRDQGINPGLFLDQRSQRQWVQENSKDKKVLNLFCYTAGFSLNAAKGGAAEIVSVDLSPKYIEWSKKNFALNNLNSEKYRFYDMDSFDFLKWASKKNQTYDIIICDPPSFSRNKNQIFKIEMDYAELISLMRTRLNPKGVIIFSTNYEAWSWKKWLEKLKGISGKFSVTPAYNTDVDFEIDPHSSIMKAFHIAD